MKITLEALLIAAKLASSGIELLRSSGEDLERTVDTDELAANIHSNRSDRSDAMGELFGPP